jgi:hypothetical protein
MNHSSISNFGSNTISERDHPLTYCLSTGLNNGFLHGGHADGPNSGKCQMFLSEYCSHKWDPFCEMESNNNSISNIVNMGHTSSYDMPNEINGRRLTQGEILIQNTAARKYVQKTSGGYEVHEPFDHNVASSPMISNYYPIYYVHSGRRIATYAVNPSTIDTDIVMDKLLSNPSIAPIILINIYNTMKNSGELVKLKGTKLGNFYSLMPYFKARGGLY